MPMTQMKIILFLLFYSLWGAAQTTTKPNIILIMTDDQGYGDLGATGNPHVKTPHIDAFAEESIRFNNFSVSPVCAPTRASLMTGRYSLRTGIRDTYNGGAIMASNEVTIAEMLQSAGYQTGIFGKWHLGDNYPSRPSEQGFTESLIHLSGGMAQVGDFTTYFQGDSAYFDPVLWHNNQPTAYEGYCSDIFTNGALSFIEENQQSPFFCYLSFNAPHTPLQVPQQYYQEYKDIDPSQGFSAEQGSLPVMSEADKEAARKVYAMVSNIDDNLGRLFQKLESLGIEDNTLIIFMTDNGPQQVRYVGGMRGRKGSVYQGGVRVPFYLKYPAVFQGNKDIEHTAAHMDILPTLSEICGLPLPDDRIIDGKSLLPLLQDKPVNWDQRPLFFYWSRRYPELYRNIALHQGSMKLVGQTNYNASLQDFELFDLSKDPFEQNNLVNTQSSKASVLKKQLDRIYQELIQSPNLLDQPKIVVGSKFENPITLNRNDAGGERGIWNQEEIFGKWAVHIKEGKYRINFKFVNPIQAGGKMYLEANTLVRQMSYEQEATDTLSMEDVSFPEMDVDLIPFYLFKGKRIFPFWMELEKLD